jgi:tetratricopeptide (TPR) repeat protein
MKLLWPAHLTAHYPYPDPMSLAHPAVLVGVRGTLMLAALLVFSWRQMPALTIGFCLFLALIAPTMGIVGFNNVPACNKFIYLPVVGLLIPLTKLAIWLWQSQGHRRLVRAAVVAVPLMLAAGELAATRQYLSVWRDTETLYRHMLSLAPKATFVREDLARWLSDVGKLDESIGLLRAAMQEREPNHPSQARLNMNLALTLGRRGRAGDVEEAVVQARRAVALNPNSARWHLGLGTLLRQQKRIQEALVELTEAIRLDGESYEAHCNLGLALIDQKQWGQAIAACERAMALYPEYTLAYLGLGVAMVGNGQAAAAISVLGHAADLAGRSGQLDLQNLAHRQLAALTASDRPETH